jgi:nucleotide-binding universal stress UspA family protein/predicted transcriptional regulator
MARLFNKILCAIDLDGSAPSALELAAATARALGAEVHVLHVISMPMPAEGAPVFVEVCRERADLARASAAELVKRYLADVPSESRVEIGEPGSGIVAAAKQLPADLVVMATHGRKGFSRFFLGSVAEFVMRGVLCPVLTAKYFPADRATVAHWMTAHPYSVAPEESLTAACAQMQQRKIRSLPVVEDGKLLGIVTDRDVRTHLKYLESTTARQAMATALLTVTPSTSIWDAARILRERKIGALPVLQDGQVVGMISTSDLLEALIELQ